MGGTFDMRSARLIWISTAFGLGTFGLGSGAAARCWVLRDRAGLRVEPNLEAPFAVSCVGSGVGGPPVL